jgi:peroxiredoxin
MAASILMINTPTTLADDNPIAKGQPLPEFTLPAPEDPAHLDYLGLAPEQPFKIHQIRAQVVIIEIFSMYCPHCQREAPTVNAFYERIQKDRKLRGRVKLIGIGAGNSPFEIAFFKKKYAVPFPLFPDEKFEIHKKIGEVRTPYFIGVNTEGGVATIFYSQLGGPDDSQQFLDALLKHSGL